MHRIGKVLLAVIVLVVPPSVVAQNNGKKSQWPFKTKIPAGFQLKDKSHWEGLQIWTLQKGRGASADTILVVVGKKIPVDQRKKDRDKRERTWVAGFTPVLGMGGAPNDVRGTVTGFDTIEFRAVDGRFRMVGKITHLGRQPLNPTMPPSVEVSVKGKTAEVTAFAAHAVDRLDFKLVVGFACKSDTKAYKAQKERCFVFVDELKREYRKK